jgi:prophage DNA circulation protein
MTWRTQMQPASFRGAGFLVESADGEAGRRLAVHEYPKRDLPYAEDLGRKARIFKVTGFVIGSGYMSDRDALLAACEEAGPGTLIHPYHGTLEVICQVCTWREELRAGGKATFSLTFMEAGERDYPAEDLDFQDQAADSADGVDAVAGDVFAEIYRLSGPAWLSAAAAGDLATALELVQDVVDSMPSLLDSQASGEFLDWLADAVDNTEETVEEGAGGVAATVEEAISTLAEVGGEDALDGLATIATFGATNDQTTATHGTTLASVPLTTANRRTQADNQSALTALARRLALSTGARVALATDYASYEQGLAVRDRLLPLMDDEIMLAGNSGQDLMYQALRNLYTSTNQAFAAKLKGLARVRTLDPMAFPRPVLALAYDLYNDLGRAGQIVALNNLPHPGLPPAGESLRVLSV